MVLSKALFLKGLAALAATVGTVAVGIYLKGNNYDGNNTEDNSLTPEEKTELDKKIENLGLPDDCRFSTKTVKSSSIECDLNEDNLKTINFKDKNDGDTLTINNLENSSTIKLKIEKTTQTDDFLHGIKFTFQTEDLNKNIEINGFTGSNNSEPLLLRKKTNPEFKINSDNKLEKAWTITSLSKKVNLKCPEDDEENSSSDKCKLLDGAVSIKILDNGTVKELKITDTSGLEEKIRFEEESDDYNQQIEIKVSQEIVGTEGESESELKLSTGSYEIKCFNGNWALDKATLLSPQNIT